MRFSAGQPAWDRWKAPCAIVGLACTCIWACASGTDPAATSASGAGGGGDSGSGTGGQVNVEPVGGGSNTCNRWTHETYAAGPDGILGTDDDVIAPGRMVQEVSASNVVVRETLYGGPGPDGAWDTEDDVIVGDTRRVPAAGGAFYVVTYDDPGLDGKWNTADDRASASSWALFDGQGRPLDVRTGSSHGPDGQWATPDDPVQRRHTYEYGDGQNEPTVLDLEYDSPGNDGAWITPDDVIGTATRRYPDWGAFSIAPGADGMWATDDDSLSSRYEDKRDYMGYYQWLTTYAAGPDAKWFTPDDMLAGLAWVECTESGFDARIVGNPGPDQMFGTDDDILAARLHATGCDDSCSGPLPVPLPK